MQNFKFWLDFNCFLHHGRIIWELIILLNAEFHDPTLHFAKHSASCRMFRCQECMKHILYFKQVTVTRSLQVVSLFNNSAMIMNTAGKYTTVCSPGLYSRFQRFKIRHLTTTIASDHCWWWRPCRFRNPATSACGFSSLKRYWILSISIAQ